MHQYNQGRTAPDQLSAFRSVASASVGTSLFLSNLIRETRTVGVARWNSDGCVLVLMLIVGRTSVVRVARQLPKSRLLRGRHCHGQ